MKTKIFSFILIIIQFSLFFSQNNYIFSSDKYENNNKDLLSLNMIKADRDYYSRAILEYEISKRYIAKYFIEKEGKMYSSEKGANTNEIYKYDIPKELHDLKTGFQFRYYIFDNENTSALNAFGIVNSDLKKKSIYIVVDYIQYSDFQITGVPKLRYAVGLRTEFRIEKLELNKKDKDNVKNINLSNIAASVQIGKLNANITMKTIGITGTKPRLNLPNNSTFDVQSYADYLKIIDTIRSLPDKKDSTITYNPEIIPIMDTYRTSIGEINIASFDMQNELEKKLKKLEKQKKHYEQYKNSKDSIEAEYYKMYERKITSLIQESKQIERNRQSLNKINEKISSLDNFSSILDVVSDLPEGVQFQKSRKEEYEECYRYIYDLKLNEAQKCFENFNNVNPNYWNAYELSQILKNEKTIDVEKLQNIKTLKYMAPEGAAEKIQNLINKSKTN